MGDEQAGPSKKVVDGASSHTDCDCGDGAGGSKPQPPSNNTTSSSPPQPTCAGASGCPSLEMGCPTSSYADEDLDLPALETPSPVLMPTQLLSPPIALHFEEALPMAGIMPTSINVSVNLHQPAAYGLSGPPDPVFLDDSMESGEREITITRNPYFDPSLSPGPADDFLSLATFDGHVGNFHFGLEEPTPWVASTNTPIPTANNNTNPEGSFPPSGEVRRKRPSTTRLHDANCAASKSKKPADEGAGVNVPAEPTAGPSGHARSNGPGGSDDGPVADDLQLECLTDDSSTEDESDDDSCIEVVSIRKAANNSNCPPEVVDLTVSEDETPTEGTQCSLKCLKTLNFIKELLVKF